MSKKKTENLTAVLQRNLTSEVLSAYETIKVEDFLEPSEIRKANDVLVGTLGLTMRRFYTLYRRYIDSSYARFLGTLFWRLVYEEFENDGNMLYLRKGFEVVY